MTERNVTLERLAKWAATTMQCNCNLDNWVPEPDTGHSWVCRIHKQAKAMYESGIHPPDDIK